MLPYGTVRLAVCSTFIVHSAVQAYAGMEGPEWLDWR
jgi:hypothetical protein